MDISDLNQARLVVAVASGAIFLAIWWYWHFLDYATPLWYRVLRVALFFFCFISLLMFQLKKFTEMVGTKLMEDDVSFAIFLAWLVCGIIYGARTVISLSRKYRSGLSVDRDE